MLWAVAGLAVLGSIIIAAFQDSGERAPEDRPVGFGPRISFGQAVRIFYGTGIAWVLTTGAIFFVSLRIIAAPYIRWQDPLVLLGILALWSPLEWVIHIVLLHPPWRNLFHKKLWIDAYCHEMHHKNPYDIMSGLARPHGWAYFVIIIPILIYQLVPYPGSLTVLAVASVMALKYEFLHYLYHTSYVPHSRNRLARWYMDLRRHHLLHHFVTEDKWLCVSSRGWFDKVAHTDPNPHKTPLSDIAQEVADLERPNA